MNAYKILNIFTSLLTLYLFFILLFDSASFFVDVGVDAGEAAYFIARRTSVFMIGISVLLFLSKNLKHSDARQFIIMATALTMLGLASMGTYELVRGYVGKVMLVSIVVESTLGILYFIIFFSNGNVIKEIEELDC